MPTMPEEWTQWQTKDNRKGVFVEYTIMGFKCENPNGEVGWHITAWLSAGFESSHDYWVAGKNFYSVAIHYFYKGTPINLFQIYLPHITEHIAADERKAVLKAIAEWGRSDTSEQMER